jgi:hypothetical protein
VLAPNCPQLWRSLQARVSITCNSTNSNSSSSGEPNSCIVREVRVIQTKGVAVAVVVVMMVLLMEMTTTRP